MTDLKPALLSSLSALPASVLTAYPRDERPLPILVLADASGGVTAQADGEPYLEECFYSVDIYASTQAETEALAIRADAVLTNLGLRRTGQKDLYDEGAYAWQKSLLYRAVLRGDTIYQ